MPLSDPSAYQAMTGSGLGKVAGAGPANVLGEEPEKEPEEEEATVVLLVEGGGEDEVRFWLV